MSTPGAAARQALQRRWRGRLLLALLTSAWLATAYWHTHKSLPAGVHIGGDPQSLPASEVRFLADVTAADAYGRPIISQAIFDELLRVVQTARTFIVLDYHDFGPQAPTERDEAESASVGPAVTSGVREVAAGRAARPLVQELRAALIARRTAAPQLRVLLITDPVNDDYGAAPSQDLAILRAAGIEVIVSDLDPLRDSNFLYSSLWRLAMRWWSGGMGRTGALGAWARRTNFKANGRNLVLADDGRGGLIGMLSSAGVQDASGADSNVAVELTGPALAPLLASELAIAHMSGWRGALETAATGEAPTPVPAAPGAAAPSAGTHAAPSLELRAQILTEGAIRDALLARIDGALPGTAIDIGMHYLSDRAVIDSLLDASQRGAAVRLILDPNASAFGRALSGIPNQPAASELVAASDGGIRVRWYRTHGERFHASLVMIYDRHTLWLSAGSANLTRRDLEDYDLEANVAIEAPRGTPFAEQAVAYFDSLWANRAALGIEYTADVAVYADASQLSYWAYRIREGLGLGNF